MYKTQKTDAENEGNVSVVCSQRWIMSYTGFLGFGIVYALRVNISVAVVCMLKTLNSTSSDDNISDVIDTECIQQLEEAKHSNDRAEIEWSADTKSTVLASFFYGYIVTQIPGGWLADKYGGKRVLGYTTGLSAVLTLLMPVCVRVSVYPVYVIRVALGLLTGVSFPAMHALLGRWAPPLERSKLVTLCHAGTMLGNTLTFTTSGLLCAYGFDNGWGSIFYVTGGLGVLWAMAWFYIAADSPTKHPRITKEEVAYITNRIEYRTDVKNEYVPWLSMAKSPAVWACITAHVCNNWTNYTLLTNIPTFMNEVLKFDIKANGALSAVPYICQFICAIFAGQFADFLRSKGYLSTAKTRKSFQAFSFTGAGVCLIATGFCSCNQRKLAVAILSLAVMFTGFGRAGYSVNHIDIAPKYAGVLLGITNTMATIPGMVAPIVAGLLTPNNLQREWRNVFYVCAAFDVFGVIVFTLFASGDIQEWAKDPTLTADMQVELTDNVPNNEYNTNKEMRVLGISQSEMDVTRNDEDTKSDVWYMYYKKIST